MSKPILRVKMPGVLCYQAESEGHLEPGVARQLRCLAESPLLSNIPASRKDPLLGSIAQTCVRVEYHHSQFQELEAELDKRRKWAPGEVFWDSGVSYLHFEFHALAGAARALVDELLFLIASRYFPTGVSSSEEKRWNATSVFRDPIVEASSLDVPEVHRLRNFSSWFERLNAYRNTFFHKGWVHGSGHYDSSREAAKRPSMNGLVVPDQASLGGRNRPDDWTWEDGTTIVSVECEIREGLHEMLRQLCAIEWGTSLPPSGTMADSERPNMMVTLPVPLLLSVEDVEIVPIFSTRELALAMAQSLGDDLPPHELIEVTSNSAVVEGTEAISLSFVNWKPGVETKGLYVCRDPKPKNGSWLNLEASDCVPCDIEALRADKIRIVSIPVDSPQTAYIWRQPFLVS